MSEPDDKLLELAHEIYNGQPALKALEEVRRLTYLDLETWAREQIECDKLCESCTAYEEMARYCKLAAEGRLPQVRAEEKP